MLCQNLKAIGEELSEISVLIGKCTYIFIYIDIFIYIYIGVKYGINWSVFCHVMIYRIFRFEINLISSLHSSGFLSETLHVRADRY
jgi:hypothetical protein